MSEALSLLLELLLRVPTLRALRPLVRQSRVARLRSGLPDTPGAPLQLSALTLLYHIAALQRGAVLGRAGQGWAGLGRAGQGCMREGKKLPG